MIPKNAIKSSSDHARDRAREQRLGTLHVLKCSLICDRYAAGGENGSSILGF
jgi:hypothetical protein